jgi:UMF1 family MFS transporter
MTLIGMASIPVYGIIGFSGTIGIVNSWEIYLVGFAYGLNLGAVQSFTRTVFSDLIPPGREAEFFSLYEITDKGSSWMGPLIVGMIYSATDNLRYGYVYLFFAMIPPILLLHFAVDHRQGMIDVGRRKADADEEVQLPVRSDQVGPNR